jgi:mannose-6-phosphate isomerase-like protein (cupin superfamily)
MNISSWKRPDWSPLPYEGCVNVDGKVIFWDERALGLALLRFGEHGTVHEHPGENDTLVACIEGHGFTSVGGEQAPFEAGHLVTWPKGVPHRLWTEDSTMLTLMVERPTA